MAGPEIVDRSSVQILIDYGGAYVGRTRNRRCIAEPLADGAHHRSDGAFCLSIRFGRPTLGQRDRCDQGPSPGPEILGREFLAHVLGDVLVEAPSAQVVDLVVQAVQEEAPATRVEQLAHRSGELRVDDGRVHPNPVLGAEAKGDPAASYLDVTLSQRGDPEGLVSVRVAIVADPKPTEI